MMVRGHALWRCLAFAFRCALAAVVLLVLSVGGYLSWCKGFDWGWPGAATRGACDLGRYHVRTRAEDVFQKGGEFIFAYRLTVSGGCPFEDVDHYLWFSISEKELFGSPSPLTPGDFGLSVESILPWDAGYSMIHGFDPGSHGVPANLKEYGNQCIVVTGSRSGERGVRIVSDCQDTRKEALVPILLSANYEYRLWWLDRIKPVIVPAAILFDVVTIPLNIPALCLALLACYASGPSRRVFVGSALVLMLAYDVAIAAVYMGPGSGSTVSDGVGGLIAVGQVMLAALFTAIIPLAVGFALAVLTGRRDAAILGGFILSGVSPFATCWAMFHLDHAYRSLPIFLEHQLAPFILVPGALAVALVLWVVRTERNNGH